MEWKKQFGQFSRVAPCLLSIIVDFMGFGLVLPLVTVMYSDITHPIFREITDKTLQNFYFGLTVALYPFMMFFGASFLGDLSDRWGRKKILLYAMVGIFFSFLLMTIGVFFQSLSIFLVGRGLSGLFAGSQPLAQAAVADISTPETKGWNMSLVALTNVLALAIGPLIGAFLSLPAIVQWEGYFLPFAAASFLALIAYIWIFAAFKETYFPPEKPHAFDVWRPLRLFKEAFLDKDIRGWMTAFLFFQIGFGLFFLMIGILLRDTYGYSSTALGIFFGYLGLCLASSLLFVYPHLLKYSLTTLAIVGIAAMGFFIALSSLLPGAISQWIVLIFITCSNITGWTAALADYSNSLPKEKQGWGMGVIASSIAVAFMISGLSSNLLNLVTVRTLIFVAGVCGMIGGLILWLVTRQKRA